MTRDEFKIIMSSETGEAVANIKKAEAAFSALGKAAVNATLLSAGLAIVTAAVAKKFLDLAFNGLKAEEVLAGITIAFSNVEKAQMAFGAAMAKSNAHAQAEMDLLQSLLAIAKDELRSRQEKVDAVKIINQRYPEYLKNLKQEKLDTDDANSAIAKQVELMLLRSKVQAALRVYEKALTVQAEAAYGVELKKVEAQREAAELASGQSNFLKEQVKLVRDVVNSVQEYGLFQNKDFSIIDKAQKDLEDANTLVNVFKYNLDELLSQASDEGLLLKILGKKEKPEKAIKAVIKGFEDLNTIATKTVFTFSRFNQVFGFGFGIDGLTTLSNDVVTELDKVDTALTGFQYTAQKKLNDMIKPVKETVKKATIEFGSLVTGAVEVLGTAIASGDLSAAFTSFANLFGGWLQNLGQQLIVYSGVLKGLQVAISSLNPAAAFAAGLLAIAAGAAIKGFATNIPSFATGGIANGPMLALIGDNPGRREAIVPSEDWREAFGGVRTDGAFIAEARISGNDLLLLVQQAEIRRDRIQ